MSDGTDTNSDIGGNGGGGTGAMTDSVPPASFSRKEARALQATFRKRAHSLSNQAFIVNTMIIMVIFLGAVAFYFADDLLVRNITQPVLQVTEGSKAMTAAKADLKAVVENPQAFDPLRLKIEEFVEAARKEIMRVDTADKRLEALVARISKTSEELTMVDAELSRNFEEMDNAVAKIKAGGEWKKLPGAPQQWPTDRNAADRLVNDWVQAAETAGNNDAYAAIQPVREVRQKRYDLNSKAWETQIALKRQAAELGTLNAERLETEKAVVGRLNDLVKVEILPPLNQFSAKLETELTRAREAGKKFDAAAATVEQAAGKAEEISRKFGEFSVYSSLVTRISILVLLVFLVQILISLYRYNMRLVTYYRSRADALAAIETNSIEALARLSEIMAPQNIDFGKSPDTPMQQLADLGKSMLQNIPKPSGR